MGMVASAVGELNAGRAAASGDRYKARVAANNAAIAEANAKYAEQKGVAKEGVVREKGAQVLGEQRAQISANGIDAGSGSAVRLQSDVGRITEVEALSVRDAAAREAYGWRARELAYKTDEQLNTWKIEQDKNRALIGYWGAGLGGSGGYASRWDNWSASSNSGGSGSGWQDTGSGSSSGGMSSGDTMMT